MNDSRYGVEELTHDINTEVPCAIVANQEDLAINIMFKTIPWLPTSEVVVSVGAIVLYDLLAMTAYQNENEGRVFLAIPLSGLAIGIATGTYTTVFSTFDYEGATDNLEKACKKYITRKLIPTAVVSAFIIGFYAHFIRSQIRVEIVSAFFVASIYLQVLVYISMLFNFK